MFGFGNKTFLGVDIGTSSIKLLELKIKNNKPVLSNYAWVDLEDLASNKKIPFGDNWPFYVKRMLGEAKISSKDAFMGIPSSGALITLVEFPDISREDLDQAIRYEAHKYIPTSLDEVVISWDVVSHNGASRIKGKESEQKEAEQKEAPRENKVQVVLVAAPKDKIEKYETLMAETGLNLKSMEIESFSLVRALVGNDQGNFVLVDIGARVCNIILVEKGVIKVNRNIDAGGRDITRVIAHSMNVDEERAEDLKTSSKNFLANETVLSVPALEMILAEIKRVLSEYYRSESGTQVDSLILSGGTANMKGVVEYFQKALSIKTVVGNPFGRIEYDSALEQKLMKVKSQFAVSVGLALKGIEEHLSK